MVNGCILNEHLIITTVATDRKSCKSKSPIILVMLCFSLQQLFVNKHSFVCSDNMSDDWKLDGVTQVSVKRLDPQTL